MTSPVSGPNPSAPNDPTMSPEIPVGNGCYFLTGPTASGKTGLAIEIAPALNAEIIALDSMTLYCGMDIGTAKPTAAERQQVPHHLIDVLQPWESASIDLYLRLAHAAIADIRSRGKEVLFVGGTPLYLKAALRGLFDGPPADLSLRAELEQRAEREGNERLHRELTLVDPQAAAKIALADRRRIIRALEVYQLTGQPISSFQTQWGEVINPNVRVACLDWPRPQLRERVAVRCEAMLASGWIEETRTLLTHCAAHGMPPSREALQAAGYREIMEVLSGTTPGDDLLDRIVLRTRQLAKRQMTWYRHIGECQFVAMGEAASTSDASAAERLLAVLRAEGGTPT